MTNITSRSNSQAGIIDIVQTEYRKHWLKGLRQAELLIGSNQIIIAKNIVANNKNLRKLKFAKKYLKIWNFLAYLFSWVPLIGEIFLDKANNLAEELELAQLQQKDFESLLRDSRMELETAEQERTRILDLHPEARQLKYSEIQEIHSQEVLISHKKACIEVEMISAITGLPRPVATILLESSPKDRAIFLEFIRDLEGRYSTNFNSSKLVESLSRLPKDRQEVYIGLMLSEGNYDA